MRAIFLLGLLVLLFPSCGSSASSVVSAHQAIPVVDVKFSSPKVGPKRGLRSWAHLSSRSKRSGVTDAQRDVLMSVAADYGVDSGLLYGLWSMESGRLGENWSTNWPRAKLLARFGSACARRYKIIKCRRRWAAVRRICQQKRNGQPICNPHQVHCSFAIALGPMQHLSTRWSPQAGEWGSHVIDYDQDGVYDPHRLTDAMASAAMHLRNDYRVFRQRGSTRRNAWRLAVRMYLGSESARRYQRGVYRYRRNWCAIKGYCK